ncbi:HAUS augmin-like complex subunit 1 [Patella vulgata]|uniref:HAUS augmin-like complex subunit 1 n=1 Tax=Patella vulgata TaxID=6465 RepID=UPI00217F6040|nr:HAUS augmin-like complex subunit 1 [Patella vulgata]
MAFRPDNMNEAHQEIQVWLEQIFGGDSIPQFELNLRTLGILHNLMKTNQTKDRDTQLIIKDHNQKAEEYTSDGKLVGDIVEGLSIKPASLSQSGVTNLRTLANLALLLEIKDTSDTSFYLALQHLHSEETRIAEEREAEQNLISQLFEKTKSSLIKYNSLQKALQTSEEQSKIQRPKIESHIKQTGFLKNKAEEYRKLIQKHQGQLVKLDVTPDIYHKTLVNKAEELQNLQQKLTPLRAKLQSYHDLPPDLVEARVKIEEMRRQVTLLEEDLSSKINMMHL